MCARGKIGSRAGKEVEGILFVFALVWVLTLTFVLCGLSFRFAQDPQVHMAIAILPIEGTTTMGHQSARIFCRLFSQVSFFIVWTLWM